MKNDKLQEYVTREQVLKLLSDVEIARVSTAETASRLEQGEEYIDLEDTVHGARRAMGSGVPIGRILPKSAVQPETWAKIMDLLGTAAADEVATP